MTLSRDTLLQIMIIMIQKIQTRSLTCDLSGGCGVAGGQTRLVCFDGGPLPIEPSETYWAGAGNTTLVSTGDPVNSSYGVDYTMSKFYLIIEDTTENSLGSYYCTYNNTSSSCDIALKDLQALTCSHGGTSSGNQIEISVSYRPYDVTPNITVRDPDGNAVSGVFRAGTVSGLVKQIQWRSNSSSLPGGTYSYTVQKTGTCELVHSCTGSVEVIVKPNAPVLTTNTPVKTGSTLTIRCTSVGYPAPSLTLKFHGQYVASNDSGTLISGKYNVTVSYSQTVYQGDDQKQVQCVLTHLLLNTSSTETVTVYYAPSSGPAITGLPSQDLIEGRSPTTMTLTCTVGVANPVPRLTWNCSAGTDTSSTRSITRVIPVHRRIDGATCTCFGSQSFTGWNETYSVTFTVYYNSTSKPLITGYSTGQILTQGVSPGTVTMELTCTVGKANPEAALEWGSNCPVGTDTSSTRSITRVISVHRTIDGDTCTCSGSQAVTGWTANDSETFTVHSQPCQPHSLKEDEHTTTSVNITWTSGCNGGVEQTFHIEYKNTETQYTNWTSGPTVPQYSDAGNESYSSEITGLNPNTLYHVRITTINGIGQSTSDSIEVRTMKAVDPGSSASVTWAVVGTMLVLFVIVIVILLVLWRRGILPNPPCLGTKKEPDYVYENVVLSSANHTCPETRNEANIVYENYALSLPDPPSLEVNKKTDSVYQNSAFSPADPSCLETEKKADNVYQNPAFIPANTPCPETMKKNDNVYQNEAFNPANPTTMRETNNVYQNYAFSPENKHKRSEPMYQDLGPTESNSLHYQGFASRQNSTDDRC
ncbi:hypothetical protein ScPMuIL_002781 [Solemya velum]